MPGWTFENVGHNPPQEAPEKFARAVLDLCGKRSHSAECALGADGS